LPLSNSKHLLAAGSLANLSLLRVWNEALTYTRPDTYIMKLPPSTAQYGAILAALALLSAAFWLLIAWAEHSRSGKLAFLVSMIIPANAVRELGSTYSPYLRGGLIRAIGTTGVLSITALIGIVGAVVLLKGLSTAYRIALACGAIVAPLIPVTVFQDIWTATHNHEAALRDKPTAPKLGHTGGRRVLWMIFDEMDQRIAFEKQPAAVNLPEFQKLRETAVYATAAYSPSSSTLSSLPSLLTGRMVKTVRAVASDDLRITYVNSDKEVRWGDEPNVFSQVRAMGYDTALVGWYHPYCRVLNRDLTSCWWTAIPLQFDSVGRTFGDSVPKYLRSLFETSLLSPFGQSLSVEEAARRIQELTAQARQAAADPSLSLVFLHIQPPHAPHAYSREKHDFSLANSPVQGYLDSLELADSILGQIRAAMEQKSLWDSTDVVVSADHSYRSSQAFDGHERDRRVPFMVKLAGSRDGALCVKTFNTVITPELVGGILRNEIRTKNDVTALIDRSGSSFHGF